MDTINIIDPSLGDSANPVDGTGSVVRNSIKFKEDSRRNVENAVRKYKQVSREGVKAHFGQKMAQETETMIDNVEEKIDEVKDEIVNEVAETPLEKMDEEFAKVIKEKSEFAKRLEDRDKALNALDVDAYVETLKPISFKRNKPLKIKPANYLTTYVNGKRFSTMIKKSPEEEKTFDKDITMDTFEPQIQDNELVSETSENVSDNMPEESVNSTAGFVPVTGDMEAVAENTSEQINEEQESSSSLVDDIPDKELTEDDISAEINNLLDQIDLSNVDEEKGVDFIDGLTEMSDVEESDENHLDNTDSKENEEEKYVVHAFDDVDELVSDQNESSLDDVDDQIRELPIVATEREDVSQVVEDDLIEAPEKEDLAFDYSDITAKDVENAKSPKTLEEMKEALMKKKQRVEEATKEAERAESELKLDSEELETIRKRYDESQKEVQKVRAAFDKYISNYDNEFETVNKRKEKAANAKNKNRQEIEEYKSNIASNEDLIKEINLMMGIEKEDSEEEKRRKH